MDLLSEVLSVLKPSRYRGIVISGGGEWAMSIPEYRGIKCFALLSGTCWLTVENVSQPVHLQSGDCFLLPRGLPFTLATDLSRETVPVSDLLTMIDDHVALINGGGDCVIAGGHFALLQEQRNLLSSALPSVVVVREKNDGEILHWAIRQLRLELQDANPGASLIADHLAQIMLVQVLRLYLSNARNAGWLFALTDEQISEALVAMHGSPSSQWTVDALATHVGMSRTRFAVRFKKIVGQSPMEYLTHWRLMLAADRLKRSNEAIAAIAHSLGYESEAAFSTAFKRFTGSSPKEYGQRAVIPPSTR